jgi:hypothetical protein
MPVVVSASVVAPPVVVGAVPVVMAPPVAGDESADVPEALAAVGSSGAAEVLVDAPTAPDPVTLPPTPSVSSRPVKFVHALASKHPSRPHPLTRSIFELYQSDPCAVGTPTLGAR